MASNISIIKINASRQNLWDTNTKAKHVKSWQFGSELVTSWGIGSNIKFSTEWEGKVI